MNTVRVPYRHVTWIFFSGSSLKGSKNSPSDLHKQSNRQITYFSNPQYGWMQVARGPYWGHIRTAKSIRPIPSSSSLSAWCNISLLESDFIELLLLWHLSWMGSKPRTLRQWDSFCLHRFVKMIDASRVIRWLNKKLVDSTSFRVLRQNEKSQNSMSHNCSPKRIAGSSNLPALCLPP